MKKIILFCKLLRDSEIPLGHKLIPLAAFIYFLFPLDIIYDFFPILGQVDDVVILFAAMNLFIGLANNAKLRKI